MTRPQLLALAKQRGFTRYSTLNKHKLIELLERGSHAPPPKRWNYIVQRGRGVAIDQLFTEYDEKTKYGVRERRVEGGYLVNGVDLDGMFNSRYVPDRTVYEDRVVDNRDWTTDDEYSDDETEDEEPAPPPQIVVVERIVEGGWFIPIENFEAYKAFIASFTDVYQPRTLLESAARVASSRKLPNYLPSLIKKQLTFYKNN